jgi:hypothetical protein
MQDKDKITTTTNGFEVSEEDFVFGEDPEDDYDDFESDEELDAALEQLASDGGGISNPTHYDTDDDDEIADEIAAMYASEGIIGCEDCALGLCDCGYDFD